jgi:hypothetical protein
MKKFRGMTAAVALIVAAGLIFTTTDATAQKTKGKTRPATTKQLMKGLVAANCGELGKLLKETEVKWEDVALKAALINEGGHLLMDDGRCPDGEWKKAAETVQASTAAILAAAEKKDLPAANAGFGKLTGEGCAVCHKAHKK